MLQHVDERKGLGQAGKSSFFVHGVLTAFLNRDVELILQKNGVWVSEMDGEEQVMNIAVSTRGVPRLIEVKTTNGLGTHTHTHATNWPCRPAAVPNGDSSTRNFSLGTQGCSNWQPNPLKRSPRLNGQQTPRRFAYIHVLSSLILYIISAL